jgi:RNA polymerase sigma factor (sigma-70 family)
MKRGVRSAPVRDPGQRRENLPVKSLPMARVPSDILVMKEILTRLSSKQTADALDRADDPQRLRAELSDDPGDAEVLQAFECAYRAAYRLLGRREDAQDVAQEAVARALARWAVVGEYADAWSTRVAINLVLGERRRGRRRLLDRSPSLVESQADLRLDLRAALRRLPRRQREVVGLRYLADLSQEQVADLLGCSVGAVRQHTARGLAKLRHELVDDMEEEHRVRADFRTT